MKPRRKPRVLDKIRTGKYAEGSKGPFASDVMMRMELVLGHLAKKPMTLEEVRTELNTYFSDWFGKRTLNHVPSDSLRRGILVARMVGFVEEIRAAGPVQPLYRSSDAKRDLMIPARSLTRLLVGNFQTRSSQKVLTVNSARKGFRLPCKRPLPTKTSQHLQRSVLRCSRSRN
jgi:hypothetical protein